MIAHVVMFRLKPGLDDEAITGLSEALSRAEREIPSLKRTRVGRRLLVGRPYEQMMTIDVPFAAILEFENRAGLHAYLDHPAHDQLAQRFFACFEQALIYDFDLGEGQEGIQLLQPEFDVRNR